MNANPIAFYAPLKSPDHDVPSGDRLMARSLISCMKASGYSVETVSQLRVRLADPFDEASNAQLLEAAEDGTHRITMAEVGSPGLLVLLPPVLEIARSYWPRAV